MVSDDLRTVLMLETVSDYRQVVVGRVSFTDNIPHSPLTGGSSEVTGISGWDQETGLM